jgi:hypothetical protein
VNIYSIGGFSARMDTTISTFCANKANGLHKQSQRAKT